MQRHRTLPLRIALVGGDRRYRQDLFSKDVRIRTFGSVRNSGNGGPRSLIAAVNSGSFDLVPVLVRWLGHSYCRAIKSECRRRHVPCLCVPGGATSASRLVERYLTDGVHANA